MLFREFAGAHFCCEFARDQFFYFAEVLFFRAQVVEGQSWGRRSSKTRAVVYEKNDRRGKIDENSNYKIPDPLFVMFALFVRLNAQKEGGSS